MYLCIYTYMNICIYTYIYIYRYIFTYIFMNIHVFIYVNICIYIYQAAVQVLIILLDYGHPLKVPGKEGEVNMNICIYM
jgi:hypothetical protein